MGAGNTFQGATQNMPDRNDDPTAARLWAAGTTLPALSGTTRPPAGPPLRIGDA